MGFNGGFLLFLGQGAVGRDLFKKRDAFLVAGFPVGVVLLPLVFVEGNEVGFLSVGQLRVGGQALGQEGPAFFGLFSGEGRVSCQRSPVIFYRGLFSSGVA
ncbi:MAG: hypothetical protein IPP68_08740 [Elusimicrobia bacterium]|nr:hypothetical protein [Elusimicrobiota bacterium]